MTQSGVPDGARRFRQLQAARTDGRITDTEWHDQVRDLLETAYLAAETVYGGSGSGGDGVRWEQKRRVIVEAINRDGAFLDIGCANGLLMESMVEWAAAGGHNIQPYGLDISERLAELARTRLPHWADRIFTGNAITWEPPRRFDFVRTELVYVPDHRGRELVEHLLAHALAPGGRLIVCEYRNEDERAAGPPRIAATLRAWGFAVGGEAHAAYPDGAIPTGIAWVDAPMPP